MTVDSNVQQHLTKAKEYLAKGEEFYRHAAAEMELAREAGATYNEIGDALDRSVTWCRDIVRWAKSAANGELDPDALPFSGQGKDRQTRYAKQMLRDPAKVQEIVNALPKEAVYAVEEAVANRLGAPIIEDKKLAGDPIAVVRAFDKLTPEQREMAVQDIVQHREFAEAVKQNPVIRDEVIVSLVGTPTQQRERNEASKNNAIAKRPELGWTEVNDGLAEMNRGGIKVLSAIAKMKQAGDFDPSSDPLGVSRKRAEGVGRTIHEIEADWGISPITDRIEELGGSIV